METLEESMKVKLIEELSIFFAGIGVGSFLTMGFICYMKLKF